MGKYADSVGQYLDLQEQGKQNQETALRSNMMKAAESDPESLARAKRAADFFNMPVNAVHEDLPEVEKRLAVEGFDYKALQENAPKTAEWLTLDELNAGVAKDDIDNLSAFERILQGGLDLGGAFAGEGIVRNTLGSTLSGFGTIYNTTARALGSAVDAVVPQAVSNALHSPIPWWLSPGEILRRPGEELKVAGEYIAPPKERRNLATDVASGVGQLTGQIGMYLLTGGASSTATLYAQGSDIMAEKTKDDRGPSPFLQADARDEYEYLLGKDFDFGLNPAEQARLKQLAGMGQGARDTAILTGGAITALTERYGLEKILNRVPPAIRNRTLRFIADKAVAGGIEAAQEFTEGLLHDLSRVVLSNDDAKILEGIEGEMTAAALSSAIVRTALGVRGHARAKQQEEFFTSLGDSAKAVKLRERLPDKFKDLAARYAGAQNAFIDAARFNEYFQTVGIDPVAVASELGVKNYSEAVNAGTDLVIPMGNFAARLAPTDHLQGLMADLKLSQGDLSAREFEAQQATAAEQEQEIAAQAEPVEESPARQQIFDDVVGQLVGRFERSTAESYATQYTAGIVSMASWGGVDPMTLHRRYGLTITSPLPDVLTKRPDLDTVIDPMIDAIRAGNLPTDTDVNGPSLTEFLRERGGLMDEGGELASRDAKQQVRGLVRDNGMSLDTAREAAAEAGYIAEDSTVSDFIDLLDNELRGDAVYSGRNRNDSLAEQQNALRELSNWMDQQGIDLNSADNAAIKRMMNPEYEGREFEQKFTAQGATEIDAGKSQASEMFAGFGGYSYSGSDLLKDGQRVAKLKLRIDGNRLVIDDIEAVRKGQGDGTQAIQAIIAHAHQNGLTPVLITDAMRGKDQQKRLRSYYERLGFIANKGDNKVKGMKEEYYFPAPATATGGVTQTPEFKAWFGDSKVVDADGKPLVVYHGSQDEFTPDSGLWFAKQPEDASEYATNDTDGEYHEGANVTPAYIAITNPLTVDAGGARYDRIQFEGKLWITDELSEEAEKRGHDGLIVRNVKDGGTLQVTDVFHVQRSEQIKSAIGNRGTFDASKPNILFQAAYHGSPYKFDKFTLDHIGSGEGAQAYGWGLYFAGNKEVAEYYRDVLSDSPPAEYKVDGVTQFIGKPNPADPREALIYAVANGADAEKMADQYEQQGASADFVDGVRSAVAALEGKSIERADTPAGQLYEVEIPNDDTLLLWDKPLSEQPQLVANILKTIDGLSERAKKNALEDDDLLAALGLETGDGAANELPGISGEQLYQEMARKHGSPEAASKYLHSLGINGIKYLDGTSRLQGEGSYNYVIFDDQAIEIVDTYYQRNSQDGARGYIRIGDNQRMSIALLERANLSTFLHETGHMWLEVLGDLATSENAPEQIQQDYKTILDWFGVESRDQIQVEHHEQFARANEAYLMEGKAPSPALRAVFQRFKAWLTMIYRSISRLDVKLNDEVRAVFDRIYASDEEIAAARAEANLQPLFSSAEQMGMTEAEFAAYRSSVTDASVVAQDRLRAEMMDEYQRTQTKWWNEEREKFRKQVETEVATLPAYVAFDALVSGAQGKLSKDDLIRRYGEAYLKRIPRGYGEGRGAVYATDGGGMDIDIAGEIFGFESGDALVQALVNMRPRKELIEAEADARMREEYGDMRLDGTIAERAELALHNDLRADVLMTELRALRRKQREVAPFVQAERARQRGERAAARTAADGVPPVDYFRNAARGLVSQQPVNELQPHRYLLAERKASRKAFEAMAKGDPNVAAAEKQRELLNHFLYLESTSAQERADKIAVYAEGLTKRSAQERIGKAGEEYLGALNEILDAYQFRRTTNKQLQLVAKVRAAVAAAEAEGEIIDVMMDEQGNVIDPVLLSVRNYRELTIDELEAVRDMLKNIEHVAKEKNDFRAAEVKATFDELHGKIMDEIADGKPAKPVEVYKLRDPKHQKWRAIPLAVAEWRGLFSYIQEAVGFKNNSTLWNYTVRPLNERAARAAVMKREAAKKLDELFQRYSTTYLYGKGKVIPGVGSVNKQQQLMLAASWGTETGRQRMLDNGFDGKGLSQDQVDAVLNSLDERDWGFVQDLWKLFDSYWKPTADKQQRVTGVRPKQVDPVPFMTKFGEMPGGYSPIAYENFLDNRSAQQQAAQIADEMKRAAYTSNTTRRGHLKQRVERIQGKAVRYDFGVIYKHLNEVIHDVTHHETLRDVQKLLNHKVDGRSILDEITQRMGYGVRDQIVETLEEIAVGDLRVMGSSERIMEHLASGASIAGMAYNVWNAVQNITGIFNSFVVVGDGSSLKGAAAVMRGAWEWIGTPRHMLESIETVQQKSEFMRTRYLNMNRDINAMRGRLEQHTGRPAVDDAYAAFRDSGFWMMIRMQQLVDMPTWIGAYDQAKRDTPDISEANAVALADQAVIAAQGGGRTVDLSKFMRGKGWARVWTVFAGYFNVTYQRTVESMRRAGVEGYTPQSVGRMVTDMFFLMMAPAAMTLVLKQAIDALVGGDEDDPEEWATKYFKEQVGYILAMFPFVRETTAAVAGYANYSGPVGARFFADVNKFIQQVWQGEVDENLVKAGVRVAGTPLGLPVSQAIKTWDGFWEMMSGEATPLALAFGPPKRD